MAEPDLQPEVQERRPAKMSIGQHTWAFVKELTAVVIGAIIVSSLLRAFVGQMFLIPSVSMENTLKVTDRVVVEKLTAVQRGQIVVFEDPAAGWSAPPPRSAVRSVSCSSSSGCCPTPGPNT